MIFTAMVRPIIMNSIQMADARLEGITDYGTPYKITAANTDTLRMFLNNEWLPPFDIGGGHFIITTGTGVYAKLGETGGLILSGNSLPYDQIFDTVGNPITSGTNYVYYEATFVSEGSTTLTSYIEYTSANGVITKTTYNLDGASGTNGTYVGIYDAGGNTAISFVKGTVASEAYFIHLAVPLLLIPGENSTFIVIKQAEDTNPSVSTDCIDLRPYIANMSWTTSIDKGYDTATVELNESASNLGKFYSYMLGQNIEIIDIYGNTCWNGIITTVYMDGRGGRIDAVGYKRTMEWFRFDKAYLMPEGGWDSTNKGPTSSQVLHDTTLMNPYVKRIFLNDDNTSVSRNWALKGYVYASDGNPVGTSSWPDNQHTATFNIGLDELDFSDGSFKCSDAISTVESFGYAYTNEAASQIDRDTLFMQFWNDGYSKICRVRKDPAVLVPDYIITRKNIKTGNAGVEISGDINDISTETYVLYSDSDGVSNVSSSTYNIQAALRYGFRTRIESSDYGPSLASLISRAAREDRSNVIGIGNVTISGNVKTGSGTYGVNYHSSGVGNNLPCYLMKAGRIVEFEDELGHGSLYKNAYGTPGVFYIGSTSFSTSSGEMNISAAETQSVVDMYVTRQSKLIN